jgi:cardiolipin synthase
MSIVELVYVAVLAVLIVREKRPALSTVAWVLSLALLPVGGLVLYWTIGPRRLARQRDRRLRERDRIAASLPNLRAVLDAHGAASPGHGEIDANERQLIALALNNSESPVTAGNDVRVLRNGAECFDAIEAAISAARRHVHVEYYIFRDDETGRRLRDLMVRKAREGVCVRLLVDAVGSLGLGDEFFAPLRAAGAETGVFNPVRLAQWRPPNYRNHRKIVVVDGAVGFTGGLNVGDEYRGRSSAGAWRDTHLRLEGPCVRALQQLFLEDWRFATDLAPDVDGDAPLPGPRGDTLVQVVGTTPDQPWPVLQQLLLLAISTARQRIAICTPYFVPDDVTLAALGTAALRGVDVHLLLPRRSDVPVVTAASRSYYDELLRTGVRIYEYLPGFLHAKALVVDGSFAMVGSANFDQRSFRINLEVLTLIYGNDVAGALDAQFDQDLTLAREVTPDERARLGVGQQLAEAFARVLSPLL